MKNRMYGEPTAAAGSIDHFFPFFGVQHPHTHFDHIAWRKELALFAFAGLVDEILEGVIDDFKVGVEEFDLFQRGHANGQVAGGEFDVGACREYAFPPRLRLLEQTLDFGLEFGFGVAVVLEQQMPFLVAAAFSGGFN